MPVTLPLSRPGLGAAILTTAIYVLEDFGNPQIIGGVFTVLPTQAYSLISGFGDFTGAAAVSTILLLLALGLYVAKIRLDGGRAFVTISGRASSMPRPPVPRSYRRALRSHRRLLLFLFHAPRNAWSLSKHPVQPVVCRSRAASDGRSSCVTTTSVEPRRSWNCTVTSESFTSIDVPSHVHV